MTVIDVHHFRGPRPYLLQHVLVRVARLDELVLADPPAQADDVRNLVLFLLQGFGDDLKIDHTVFTVNR